MGLVVLEDVAEAILEGRDKHGPLTEDPIRASVILMEEVGEVALEALSVTRRGSDSAHRTALYYELAQVAATAMLMMENVRRMK